MDLLLCTAASWLQYVCVYDTVDIYVCLYVDTHIITARPQDSSGGQPVTHFTFMPSTLPELNLKMLSYPRSDRHNVAPFSLSLINRVWLPGILS